MCLVWSVEASDCEIDEVPDDSKVAEKDTALHLALSQLAGDFDEHSKLSLQRFSLKRRVSVISTGSLNLDLALGVGGLPKVVYSRVSDTLSRAKLLFFYNSLRSLNVCLKGRMVEVYGKEASGKTTLALHIIKEAQKLGGTVLESIILNTFL